MRDHVDDVFVLYSAKSQCNLASRKYPVETHSFKAMSNTIGVRGSKNCTKCFNVDIPIEM
jgi:hypothetical protein